MTASVSSEQGVSNVLIGNRLVYSGGLNTSTYLFDAEGIAINADGSLAAGALIPEIALPSGGLAYHSAIVLDNAAWLIGGLTRDGLSGAHMVFDLR